MLTLATNIDIIGEYSRLLRINLQRMNGEIVTTKCMSEYDEFEIKAEVLRRKIKFIFTGYLLNRAGEVGGFGCQIPIRLPHKLLPIKTLCIDVSAPQIINNDVAFKTGDIFYEDHAFFAIDNKTKRVKLFHTCNFEPQYFDINNKELINFAAIKHRFLKTNSLEISKAKSPNGIVRKGIEIYDLSSGEFHENLDLLYLHLKFENIRIIRKRSKQAQEEKTSEQIWHEMNIG
jgi:hypothetical protein